MRKSTLFLLLFTGWYAGIVAQEARPVTISGQIRSDMDSVRLIVWFGKDPVIGYGEEMLKIPAAVKPDGTFSFTTPPISQFARLEIFDAYTGNYLFTREQQFVAPGDSIYITATIQDKAEPTYCKVLFSGKGSAKFECVQALKTDVRFLYTMDTAKVNLRNAVRVYDSLMASSMAGLKGFANRLSKEEYALILADKSSSFKTYILNHACGYNPGSVHSPVPTADQLAARKKVFDELMRHFNDAAVSNNTAGISLDHRKYLLQKAKTEQVFENKGQPVTLMQLFNRLNKRYSGVVREKLLGHLLLDQSENHLYFGGIDAEDHLYCVKTAFSAMQSGELKQRLQQALGAQVKGASAFNFNLPVDSSGKTMTLGDLKGKVVLLDLWSYQCTACVVFANTFHKKIFPTFQNNPDFAVVSIMLGPTDKEKYMYRLRRGGGVSYTFPEYINLFGGKGIESGKEMERYYMIDAYPATMLIDKQGKIYSTTLPVIYGDPRNAQLIGNQQKLINLIQQALSEPAVQKPVL